MKTFVLGFFTLAGILIGIYQFRTFPWRDKPAKWKLAIALLLHVAAGAAIGLFMGGWLAGQIDQIF